MFYMQAKISLKCKINASVTAAFCSEFWFFSKGKRKVFILYLESLNSAVRLLFFVLLYASLNILGMLWDEIVPKKKYFCLC